MLECDASGSEIDAVLSVERDGDRLPVAFFSRQLHGAQARYSAQELEGLGVVRECQTLCILPVWKEVCGYHRPSGIGQLEGGETGK